ncbi:hypothetical protein ABEB36_006493 [Hypothenemus hampei]|uniref:Proteasome activator complex subunit 4 n=1 Tax=Hypothenemus hampei TaxID=57062 RepID=A0ABD1EQQ5_HYPHA
MDEDYRKQRAEVLGYCPQKENVYNQLLPYAKQLDEESEKLFVNIKTNLVKSVLSREIRPGCAIWTSRLQRYIRIYGLKFSKEDHIALIKLFYEVITIPYLEPTVINKFATALQLLIKKKNRMILTRDDLQLDWRPLYDLCVRTIENNKTDIGMYRCATRFQTTLFSTIRDCKVYFPASATQEILDELRPKLCPYKSGTMSTATHYLDLLLPNAVKPEEASISYKLWFEEFMNLWQACNNAHFWESDMMWIMSGLARFQIGQIDWSPYVSNMFARFLRSFQLPITFKQREVGRQYTIDTGAIAIWIVCTLHSEYNGTFLHLEKLMQTIESYFYPANAGRWTYKLREFLRKLAYFFVQRVHWERYENTVWTNNVPDHFKLTDSDIDRFVNILKPCIEPAMFSRVGSQDISLALSYLSSLRPNLIIPGILDKLYSSVDSLTEPHKLTCSLQALVAVGRYMVQGKHNNYPEGPTHVIPLLLALLPGIDPNDVKKSYGTFSFIEHFVHMIPLIDSSKANIHYNNLTDEEHIICEASAEFEDFVLQFFERIMLFVDSNSIDRVEQSTNTNNIWKNLTDYIAETAIGSVVEAVLVQCSPSIFQIVLRKFSKFISQKILDVQVAGKMLAVVTQKFTIVNPRESLKVFLPYLLQSLQEILNENPSIVDEENVDAKFLFHLLILSEVVDGRDELLPYLDRLTYILDQTLHMTSPDVQRLAAKTLSLILGSLSHIRPIEKRSSTTDYGAPIENFLSVREWAKPHKIQDINIEWYAPKDKEISAVQSLINKYLVPELKVLEEYSQGERKLNRQELKSTLKIITAILSCHLLLPIWKEPAYRLLDSVMDSCSFNLSVIEKGEVTMPDGSNIRKSVVNTVHATQKKLLETDEGDTQSFQHIVNIYNIIVFNKSDNQNFEIHWKRFVKAKRLLKDLLHQKKQHLRHMHIDRVMLQQELRIENRKCLFTPTHKQILLDLIDLSVCRYSEVRKNAQSKLNSLTEYFPYSFQMLTDRIKEILQMDTVEHHETFKGCLYILLGPTRNPIIARRDWKFIQEIWPLLVQSKPSEKPSIVNLIAALTNSVHKFFPTITINLVIPEKPIEAAYALAEAKPYICDLESFQNFIDKGEECLMQKSLEKKKAYEDTVQSLLDNLEKGNLHWRYHIMAISFIRDLVHFDVNYSSEVVKFFLKSLINESLNVRKHALRIVLFITIQNKPKFKKLEVDPYKFSNSKGNGQLIFGEREDNAWLLYDVNKVPKTEAQWEEMRYLNDEMTGYYAWPKKLMLYAPASQQPSISSRLDQMTDTEREIYEFFSNEANVAQLIKYFSLEEKKGVDQFNGHRFRVLKNIFKMFQDEFLEIFMKHLRRLVQDKQESSQRCVAEIVAALIRGSKHWPFKKVENLWQQLLPILNTAIINMSTETLNDWTLCLTMSIESRDPNMCHWILEFLMEDPLKDSTSFIACSRLQMLNTAIIQQPWRNVQIFSRLMDYLRPHLTHPFQNIRDKISQILSLIYSTDFIFPQGAIASQSSGPKTEDFFAEVAPKLEHLKLILLTKGDQTKGFGDNGQNCDNIKLVIVNSDEEKDELMRLYKVVSKYVITSMSRVNFTPRSEYWRLLLLAALLQNYEIDEEIATISTNLLVVLGQSVTLEQYIPDAIQAVIEVSRCHLWSARSVLAEFLPVFILFNMPTIQSNSEWVIQIQDLVLQLLEDVQLEVRVKAAKVVSGLLHCHFIPQPIELLTMFRQKARTKIKKAESIGENSDMGKNLILRHAGVLGLCSFINAHPYDVPEYFPTVFAALGSHLSDPQPIPATIRKTMGDFKRTHHDNWELHKLKFTEDELSLLSDLSVPPSYYV